MHSEVIKPIVRTYKTKQHSAESQHDRAIDKLSASGFKTELGRLHQGFPEIHSIGLAAEHCGCMTIEARNLDRAEVHICQLK